MEYSEEQIKFIQKNNPDFGFKVVPSLDSVVVEFLKKNEVFIKPMTSGTRDVKGDIASGVITGILGADVGMDTYGVKGQKKQTQVQEWTQWKQWALNHKDFENFRIEKIENPKEHNLKILESLKDPKVQNELQPIMEQYKNLQEVELKDMKTYRRIFGIIVAIFIVLPVIGIIGISLWNFLNIEINNNRQESSLLIR